jgi:hypothetical protein
MIGPLKFVKFISVVNFIFNIFRFLVGERRKRKWPKSGLEKEKCYFNDSDNKNITFLFQIISYDEESLT